MKDTETKSPPRRKRGHGAEVPFLVFLLSSFPPSWRVSVSLGATPFLFFYLILDGASPLLERLAPEAIVDLELSRGLGGVAEPRLRRGERVPHFIAIRFERQRAVEGGHSVRVAAGVEIQLADRRMRLRIAPVDEHGRHQLAERIGGTAVGGVGAGQLLVDVRIVRVEARRLRERVDRAGGIALDLREAGNPDKENAAADERARGGGLVFTPGLRHA